LPRRAGDAVGRPQGFGPERPLRILIDTPTVTDRESAELLSELLVGDPEFEVWTTTESERWVEIDWTTEVNGYFPVQIRQPGRTGTMALPTAAQRAFASQVAANSEIAEAEALRQLGFALWAKDYEVSLMVTDSPILLVGPFQVGVRVNIRSARDTVGIVAQLERTLGRYELGHPAAYDGPFWLYLIGSRAVLRQGSRWFSACQASTGPDENALAPDLDDPSLRALGQTTLERVDWVLRARDLLASAADTSAMPLYVDTVLVQLSAAFDAAAWVTDLGLGIKGSPGWRKQEWVQRLVRAHPPFAEVLATGSATADAIEILSLPRNTIHDSGMPTIGASRGSFLPSRTTLRIPRRQYGRRLLNAIERQGGAEVWGLEALLPEVHVLDPLLFVERCVVAGLSALDALMGSHSGREVPRSQGD
jgi:hypothetical protein